MPLTELQNQIAKLLSKNRSTDSQHENLGYVLHPMDLAINKVLALAGRNEPRDFLDVLHVHDHVLPLGALCWAASGKDPGFTPLSLLDLLRRRGKFQQEDFNRLKLKQHVDLTTLKTKWLYALDEAQEFINQRPPKEIGCLYYSKIEKKFFAPQQGNHDYITHYGQPGGILPNVIA